MLGPELPEGFKGSTILWTFRLVWISLGSIPWQMPLKLSFPPHYGLNISEHHDSWRATENDIFQLCRAEKVLGVPRNKMVKYLQCVSKNAAITNPPFLKSCLHDLWWFRVYSENSPPNNCEAFQLLLDRGCLKQEAVVAASPPHMDRNTHYSFLPPSHPGTSPFV